jgi:hypothetical protein
MGVRRYLLVLDMDLLAVDEQCDPGPISYLAGRQEHEPCEVVVLSLATGQPHLPATEMLIFAGLGRMPLAPPPDPAVSAVAEHRMDLAKHYLEVIGCEASGIISDEDPVKAVRSETRARDYDAVILATPRLGGSWLAHLLHLDPVHQLQRRWGKSLIVCQPRPGTRHARPRPSPKSAGRR